MNPSDDWDLVEEYASRGSHAAFEALVQRHAGWAYATARRRVKSADLADDVTQAAFIVLARKAGALGRRESLSAWLYRVIHYAAIDALRRQGARRRHERAAARTEIVVPDEGHQEELLAHLDGALDALNGKDREAIILRFFNNQTLEQIGRIQNVNTSTVQRRLERSLARMGYHLKRRGVVTAPALLAGTLAGVGLCTAPPSAVAGLTGLATAAGSLPIHTAGSIGLAKGTLKTMTMIKLKLAASALIAAAAVGTGSVIITRAVAQPVERPILRPVVSSSSRTNTAPPITNPTSVDDEQFAKQFRSDWLTSSLTLTCANPNAKGQNAADSQALSINCAITVLDTQRLLGFDRWNRLKVTRILDDAGHDVTGLAAPSAQNEPWFAPLSYSKKFDNQTNQWMDELQPQQFYIALRTNPPRPKRLSVVEGYVLALTCERQEQVDLPFVPNGQFVTVLPGLRLRFASAKQDGNSASYELAGEGPRGQFSINGLLRKGQVLPERIVVNEYMVDRTGKRLDGEQHPFGNFPSIGPGTGGMSGVEGQVAAMRWEVAIGLRERRVPVILKNIELPSLPKSEH